ncbi:MAG: hypothetical protein J7J36_03130 [Thermoplasmata archaeon]|nr:hypothetical protein [Thermoplasmata archaeon]
MKAKGVKDEFWKIISIVLIIVIIILAASFYPSEKKQKENKLSVDAMYLLKEGEEKGWVNASAIIYLTNTGAKSGEIKIITYLIESRNGIAVDKKEIKVGSIEKDKTEEEEIQIQMENSSYNMDVLVFEDGLLKVKGGTGINVFYDKGWNIEMRSPEFYEMHGNE